MNANLRVEINKEVMDAMHSLSDRLSLNLFSQLSSYIDDLSKKFNHSIDVRGQLLKAINVTSEDAYNRQLESALSALFLRLARPLARSLMKHRHGLDVRHEEVVQFGVIFRSLSDLYPNEKPDKYANLSLYLVYGSGVRQRREDAVSNAAKDIGRKAASKLGEKLAKKAVGVMGEVVVGAAMGPIAGATSGVLFDKVGDMLDSAGDRSRTVCYSSREDITRELEEDREALQIYLEEAVFRCSGIGEYADQELLRIREKFVVDCKNDFYMLAINKFKRKDPAFMKLVPPNLQNTEFDTQVADRLKELSISLKQRSIF